MNNCITSILSYPFSHIGKLRKLTSDQIFLKQTQFSPAYTFFLIASALCNMALSAWIIYYFISEDTSKCYNGVTLGVQILACVYPLYQGIIFLTLISSIAHSQNNWWKVLVILWFTIITTSFGFGGLGVVYSCLVHQYAPLSIPATFITQNYFIQIIVYAMLIFIIMYILLVPFTTWLHSRKSKEQNQKKDSCDTCVFVFHMFFQFLLFLGTVVFIAIAIGGVPILFYLLNGIAKTSPIVQGAFFGLTLNSLISPYVVFLIVYLFSRFIGCGEEEHMAIDTNAEAMHLKEVNTPKGQMLELSSRPMMQNNSPHTTTLQSQQVSSSIYKSDNINNSLSKSFNSSNTESTKIVPNNITASINKPVSQPKRKTIDLSDKIPPPLPPQNSTKEVLLESNPHKEFGESTFFTKKQFIEMRSLQKKQKQPQKN